MVAKIFLINCKIGVVVFEWNYQNISGHLYVIYTNES